MKCFKVIGIMSLLFFSFFLTDFVTELAIDSNPLMKSIKNNSNDYNVCGVNAIIEDNTIIPGIKGKKVNEKDSFLNMKDFGVFNSNYLIYDNVIPDVSLEDNKNKVIISGNTTLRQVSILIKDNEELLKYSKNNNISYSKLIKFEDIIDSNESINIEANKDKFKDVNTLLNKSNLNKKICILNYSNIEECKDNKYYLVKYNLEIKNNNISNELNNISNGSIIFIDKNLSLDNYKLLINYIKNKDLKIVHLSKLIEE